jgi:hypothetical protein
MIGRSGCGAWRRSSGEWSMPLVPATPISLVHSTSMRAARVLAVGVRGVTTEVLKNLALAGVHTLSLWDDAVREWTTFWRIDSRKDSRSRLCRSWIWEHSSLPICPTLVKMCVWEDRS